jgi:type IV secretory pathway VirB10-like protein
MANSNTNPDPTTTSPQVQDKRSRPLGILPQNTQVRVLGGVALLMVIVIALSGRNTPKDKSVPTPPNVVDPNTARIEAYQKAVAEQTRKLQLEQAQLARTQQALGMAPGAMPGVGAAPATLPYAYSRPADLTYAVMPPSPESSFEADLKKREYESRFASNIALSYRQGAAAMPALTAAAPLGAYPSAWAQAAPYPAPYVPPGSLLAASAPPSPQAPAAGAPTLGAVNRENLTASIQEATAAERNLKGRKHDQNLDRAEGKRYRLFEGTVFETVLTNRLDGSFSGPVNCMVTTNVYSHNGLHLLIPQGSRILGEVKRVETFGQQRLAIMFHRLIMPDGYSVSLDKFQGLNQIGETGLVDQVNHHYMQVFGVSLAIGAIAGLSQANTRYGLDESAADAYRQGVATSLSQSSLRILDRYLNVLPTFTIREGHRVKVYLSDDLLLPAYDQHQMPSDL